MSVENSPKGTSAKLAMQVSQYFALAQELAESLPLACDQESIELLGIDILKANASFFEGLAYTMLVES